MRMEERERKTTDCLEGFLKCCLGLAVCSRFMKLQITEEESTNTHTHTHTHTHTASYSRSD